MLLYSTIFDIKGNKSKQDFVELVLKWNRESMFAENRLDNIEWHGEMNVVFKDKKLCLEIMEYGSIVAIRYEKIADDGAIWVTGYVMNFAEGRMSVRLDRSFIEGSPMDMLNFSVPYFVSLLISENWLKDDSGIAILDTVLAAADLEAEQLGEIFNGANSCALPVVCILAGAGEEMPLDTDKLARHLKGIAHVIVGDEGCSAGLAGQNDGVLIAFPNGTLKHYQAEGEESLFNIVKQAVLGYATSINIDALYTFQGVAHAAMYDRWIKGRRELQLAVDEKRQAKNEADELLENFDAELKSLQDEVKALRQDNNYLRGENSRLAGKAVSSGSKGLQLSRGTEKDFYEDEARGFILDALAEAMKKLPDKSRRRDVLQDILDHNSHSGKVAQNIEAIKRLFRGYSKMSNVMERELIGMGFSISDVGRHYRLKFYEDKRYQTTVSKTGSDRREGDNNAAEIIKRMF